MQFHDCNGETNTKNTTKEDTVIKLHTEAGSITTNIRVKIYFTLTGLSTTKIVTCNCRVDESAKVRYESILGIYLLTALVLNLKFSDNVIEADDGIF